MDEKVVVKPNYYAIIPANVRYDEKLSAQAKLFYGEITALCGATGECFAGNPYFQKIYGMSKSQVIRTLNLLEERGYITVLREAKSRKIFLTGRVAKMTPQGRKNDTLEGRKNDTHNNININNNINNIYSADFIDWYTGYPRKEDKQRAYKNYLRCIKNGYTPEQLITARDNYMDFVTASGYETKYIKSPANFLGRDEDFIAYLENEEKTEAPAVFVPDEVEEAVTDGWYR